MLFKDLVEVSGVDARDRRFSCELERNAVWLVIRVSVSDVDGESVVVELRSLS